MEKSVFTDDYKAFLQQLRAARKAAGLTQEELAERLHPTTHLPLEEATRQRQQMQRFVSRCETGERRVDVLELRVLCHALGISYLEFLRILDTHLEPPTSLNAI